MLKRNQCIKSVIYSAAMLLLILDAKQAVSAAAEGTKICLYTLLPSVFPFIFISILLNSSLSNMKFSVLKPIGKAFRLPGKAENLLLSGFLGGYPVGAQSITDAWKNGTISKSQAHRLLSFCSNAGPAFIFGFVANGFSNRYIPWIIWLIHILSALIVAQCLPYKKENTSESIMHPSINLTTALNRTILVMAQICGWVIIFRVIIGFINKWIKRLLSPSVSIWVSGLLELTNGCIAAEAIQAEGLRFVLICTFISLGGLCVLAQTMSVTTGLGIGFYFPGKILQACFSALLAMLMQPLVIQNTQLFRPSMITIICLALITLGTYFMIKQKKQ